ncbi:hypothetical protein BT681P4_00029 [Bacteroides phage BT681P4]|nr:hypothetical protein BT681P2_00005 [Bacteroides phage BT681P2]WAX09952.1 hypothetical protein BT681P4_00029 [Bacteroides phage BT681P4]
MITIIYLNGDAKITLYLESAAQTRTNVVCFP